VAVETPSAAARPARRLCPAAMRDTTKKAGPGLAAPSRLSPAMPASMSQNEDTRWPLLACGLCDHSGTDDRAYHSFWHSLTGNLSNIQFVAGATTHGKSAWVIG